MLVLGGLDEKLGPLNDVWRSDDEGQNWELVSPHDAGRKDGGSRILTKWIGRWAFAAATAWSYRNGRVSALLYVVGGIGPCRLLADVWVSQDLGRTFVRMCSQAPFGARSSPSLAVCPGSPERLILAGGAAGLDMYEQGKGSIQAMDCWLSLDAGESWDQVSAPEITTRKSPKLHFTTSKSILLLGGASMSMVGQALTEVRTPANDAFAADVDWTTRSLCWRSTSILCAKDGRVLRRPPPLQAGWVAGLLRSSQLVVCTAEPEGAAALQSQKQQGGPLPLPQREADLGLQARGSPVLSVVRPCPTLLGQVQHVLIPAGGLSLILLTSGATWSTRTPQTSVSCSGSSSSGSSSSRRLGASSSLAQQLLFLEQLGSRLEAQGRGLPTEIWSRVMALLFHPRMLLTPGLPSEAHCQELLKQARRALGDSLPVCILGPATADATTCHLAGLVARHLDAGLDLAVCFVTRGEAGPERSFAAQCGDGSQVFHLCAGRPSGCDSGRDLFGGATSLERRAVLASLGDLYIVFGGDSEADEVVQRARERGAQILPVGTTGCTLPLQGRRSAWSALQGPQGTEHDCAKAVLEFMQGFARERETVPQAVSRLTAWFGNMIKVCVVLPEAFSTEEGRISDLTRLVAADSDASMPEMIALITMGSGEIHQAFLDGAGCTEVYSLRPATSTCAAGIGSPNHVLVGSNPERCREVFEGLGDIFLILDSGRQGAQLARTAVHRGVPVVPCLLTVGPDFEFHRPAAVSGTVWGHLTGGTAEPRQLASVSVDAVVAVSTALEMERNGAACGAKSFPVNHFHKQQHFELHSRCEGQRCLPAETSRERHSGHQHQLRTVNISVTTARGIPCCNVQVMPDDRIATLREVVRTASPLLNGKRFMFMLYTECLVDDMTIAQAGLENGAQLVAADI